MFQTFPNNHNLKDKHMTLDEPHEACMGWFTNHFADFSVSEAGARSQTPLGTDSAALEKGGLICACAVNTERAAHKKETREFIQRRMLYIATYRSGGNNAAFYILCD